MDYKKSYEDALERAKGIYNENPSSSTAKFVCGQIFPEIKESEDERIRKELLEYFHDLQLISDCDFSPSFTIDDILAYLEKLKEQKPKMIQWTGKNLKEVIDFTGKSPRFDEWFKSWEDFENYVHSHEDILKLFCEDGSHYEVPVGSWIVKTPDGFNVPSLSKFVQKPAEWSEEDEDILDSLIRLYSKEYSADAWPWGNGAITYGDVVKFLKSLHPHPAKSPLAEGVYYIKDGKPVAEYEDGVETDRLLIIGKYCRFYLSMADLGKANYEDAQNKAASLGEGWRCPDSFEGRTIGKMSDEIIEKAAKIGAEHFEKKGFFWTNEVFVRWNACYVDFYDGSVYSVAMNGTGGVLALSAFQN